MVCAVKISHFFSYFRALMFQGIFTKRQGYTLNKIDRQGRKQIKSFLSKEYRIIDVTQRELINYP